MILEKIKIKNFRSIKELELNFNEIAEKKCFILLGINESGKSNILKAISLLNKDQKVDYNLDCNKEAIDSGETISVTYSLEIEDTDFYIEKLKETINPELAKSIKINKSIRRYVEIDKDNERHDGFYVYIENNEEFQNYCISNGDTILPIKEVYDGEEEIADENIEELLGSDCKLLTKGELEVYLEGLFFDLFEANAPEVIFWESKEQYLINEPVHLENFKKDNSISMPLRNIFKISGIEDIGYRIDLIKKSDEKRQELEELLSQNITKHINEIWKENKIKIKIRIEKYLNCKVSVEDKDNSLPKYKMNQRSDGFKQFISILLNLSAENKTNILKNKIILLDEPETHMHPSGVRYLRDEILRIAENNTVLLATHSIYMIDKKNIDRHISVERKHSLTKIAPIDKNNPYKEEVLYEALGTSIFEIIEPNMIIFEGKTDRDIFDAFTKKLKSDLKPQSICSISADGVESIPKYTKFFNQKLIKGYIVLDADKDGLKIKEQVLKDENFNNKNLFTINDIRDTGVEATLEDMFDKKILLDCVKERYDIDLEVPDQTPLIAHIKKKLKENKKIGKKDNLKELKADFCKKVIKDVGKLKKADVKEKYSAYYKFCENLHEKIKQS